MVKLILKLEGMQFKVIQTVFEITELNKKANKKKSFIYADNNVQESRLAFV